MSEKSDQFVARRYNSSHVKKTQSRPRHSSCTKITFLIPYSVNKTFTRQANDGEILVVSHSMIQLGKKIIFQLNENLSSKRNARRSVK